LFDIYLTDEAKEQLKRLKNDKGLSKRYKAVKKAIQFLSQNPRHPGLQTHEFTSLKGSQGEKFLRLMPSRLHRQPIEYSGIMALKNSRSLLSQSLLIHSSPLISNKLKPALL
jgi:transcriptional regulator GlxA family with amidase domain